MITEEDAVESVEWLLSRADEVGEARANAVQTEEHVKIVRASLMRRAPSDCKSASDREAWARAHTDYKVAVDGAAAAAGFFEAMRQKVAAHQARIECWRSLNAALRRAS